VTAVDPERRLVQLTEIQTEPDGQRIGDPVSSTHVMNPPQPPRTVGQVEFDRDTITVNAGRFDCIRVTLRGRDSNNQPFINRTWYSPKVPVTGVVRTEVRSGDRLQRGEELEAYHTP
jgi:hypothetical protein